MEISFLGHSSFLIKGKDITIVTDPYGPELGAWPKESAQVVTVSHAHPGHNNITAVSGDPLVLHAPGEYEARGAALVGIRSFHDAKEGKERGANTVFTITLEELVLCHLGDLGHELDVAEREAIGEVDVLFVPAGDATTLTQEQAAKVVAQLEPKIVIPMHFREGNIKHTPPLLPLEGFLKEMGAAEPKKTTKLRLTKKELPEEQEVVILERG